MEAIEKDIQKKLVSLCNILPVHVDTWKTGLKEIQNPVKALTNFTEQLKCIEQTNIKYMDNFTQVQRELQIKILGHIEEELETIQSHLETLQKSNHDLKNKLSTLERSTTDLDWDSDFPVIKGSPIQPRLDKLLQMAYEFWIFFSRATKNINSKLKDLNIRDEKSVEEFQKSCCFNLELEWGSKVYPLLALTQYLINEKL